MIGVFHLNILFFFFIFGLTHCFVEKKIVAVIPTYNAEHSIVRTLSSVFDQSYTNFYIYFIDDASQDNTKKIVLDYLDSQEKKDKITCIFNQQRRRKLANIYTILQTLKNDDIVFLLDGDDWLCGKNVFTKINAIYQDNKIWMTYGNYKNIPQKEAILWNVSAPKYCGLVDSDIIKEKKYRISPFVYMHPRTFYVWLFKLVRLEDLISEEIDNFVGDFFPACNDKALLFPMIEMAGDHVHFIDEVLYYRNLYSPLIGFKIDKTLQLAASEEIKKKNIYPTLQHPIKRKNRIIKKTIAVIINYHRTDDELAEDFNTLIQYSDNYTIFLFYEKNTSSFAKATADKMADKKNIKLIPYNSEIFHEILNNVVLKKFKYILYIDDFNCLSILNQNILPIMTWLQRTFSPLCIFGEKPSNMVHIVDNIYAYKKVLNKNIPKINAVIIETKMLQKKCNNAINLHELFIQYINSSEYNLGLYVH